MVSEVFKWYRIFSIPVSEFYSFCSQNLEQKTEILKKFSILNMQFKFCVSQLVEIQYQLLKRVEIWTECWKFDLKLKFKSSSKFKPILKIKTHKLRAKPNKTSYNIKNVLRISILFQRIKISNFDKVEFHKFKNFIFKFQLLNQKFQTAKLKFQISTLRSKL